MLDIRNFDWKGVVGAVAPNIAMALGGPLAGLAVKTLSESLLGRPTGTQDEVAAALMGANTDQLAALKRIDAEFQQRMRELDIDLERIAAEDRSSARQREISSQDSWTPRLIGTLALGGFLWSVYWVLTGQATGLADPAMLALVGTLVGYVSAKADQVIGYYFGSSAGSARKTEALSDALERGIKR